jgi:DNA primase
VGSLKLTVPLASLARSKAQLPKPEITVSVFGDVPEVHARARSTCAACASTRSTTCCCPALDNAVRADLRSLRIIHGKGTGALRERVTELLRKDTRARSFRMGLWNEGGPGVTGRRARVAAAGVITPGEHRARREAADIVEIVGEHVKLRRSGGDYRGPCPFHGGKNPNFSVSPKNGFYTASSAASAATRSASCASTSASTSPTPVKHVAERSGVQVQEVFSARAAEERDAREPLWEANAAAAELFRALLWDEASGPEARAARAYLDSRGLTRADADRFGLGPRAARPGGVARAPARAGARRRAPARGRAARQREDQDAPRPRFRDRLMIPIHDGQQHVVGFGGRLLRGDADGKAPKYLNSPQTALFDKGRQLYGLSWAKGAIRKAERALVVEGYFDAIRLAVAGVEEAVAPLGHGAHRAPGRAARAPHEHGVPAVRQRRGRAQGDLPRRARAARPRRGAARGDAPRGRGPGHLRARARRRGLEAHLAQAVDLFDRQIQLLERRGWFAELHRRGAPSTSCSRRCARPATRSRATST